MSLGFAPLGTLPLGGTVEDPIAQSVSVYQITESESLFSVSVSTVFSASPSQITESELLFDSIVSAVFSAAPGQITESELLFDSEVILTVSQITESETLSAATGRVSFLGKTVYVTLSISRHIAF
jgi:hypothetical protein